VEELDDAPVEELDDAPVEELDDAPVLEPPASLPASYAGVQTPAAQDPAGQGVPSGRAGLEHTPVSGAQVPAWWQASEGAHTAGLEPVHTPAWHVSVGVQRLPSSHALPSGFEGFEHNPLSGSHEPARWHESSAAQITGLSPVQTPAWQVSIWVHALMSSHAVPSALAGLEQAPVDGAHTPATWQPSRGAHTMAFEPRQTPP
jgi:hypothetical protein